jgi:predicted transposase YdaD
MTKVVKSNKEVSVEYMKIYEKEKMLKDIGRAEGREEGREEGAKQQAIESARLFFINGADFQLVRNSITLLTDEKLQEIYDEVKES